VEGAEMAMLWGPTALDVGVQGDAVLAHTCTGRAAGRSGDVAVGQAGTSSTASASGPHDVALLQHQPDRH
jgi:hypothetical protein